jgi:hypothetical protein
MFLELKVKAETQEAIKFKKVRIPSRLTDPEKSLLVG